MVKNYLGNFGKVSVVLILFTTAAFAVDRESLYGEWGTEQQCHRELITPKGTKHAAPFTIGPDWFAHGEVWCRLIWSNVTLTTDGLFAMASSLCGEDAVRDYQVDFKLTGNVLTLIWNQEYKNGPLMRCTAR